MPGPDLARLRLLVHGRVQGVGFRYAAAEEAHALALPGWVRNLPNGDVEIVAEGQRRELQMLAAWAHQGHAGARNRVREEWSDYLGEYGPFAIR